MSYPVMSAQEKRRAWWQSQRNVLSLPRFINAPLAIAVLLVLGLGAGSCFLGLLPGVNTHEVTLSGAGTPWIGLVILLVVAALWYWRILHNGYSLLAMGGIVALAIVIALLLNGFALNTLAPQNPDATIGGLGIGWLFGGLLLATGFTNEGFILSLLMGAFMGVFLGVLSSFMFGFEYILIFVLIYGPIGILAGGIGGVLRPIVQRAFRK
jgi:hypothetical protein